MEGHDRVAPRWFWAKTKKNSDETHALLYHLIDSGQVALALWRLSFSPGQRRALAAPLGLPEDEAGRLLATWIAWHDIGKASPAFQSKYRPAAERLLRHGLPFPNPNHYTPEPHGLVSTWLLAEPLRSFGLPKRAANLVARALGGHHGAFPTPNQALSPHRAANLGAPEWNAARQSLLDQVREVLTPPAAVTLPEEEAALNAFLATFAGWASVSDWLASIAERFWCPDYALPLATYAERSRGQAEAAVRELGWTAWQPTGAVPPFDQVFPFAPNPVQEVVDGATRDLAPPALAIIEAPTGSGKTEAALYLAERWLQAGRGRGVYVAMPTQATSNQMFTRAIEFLGRRYPADLVNVHLVHGQAWQSETIERMTLSEVGEDTGARVAALAWFLPRKRTLLAPFGVGTVDQTFLGVLQTRHFFVRLFGLGQKVVIFDEVHAYDTYMSELFWRLLAWLRAVGASAIVLSATLPAETRRRMIAAYGGVADASTDEVGFPCLSLVAGGKATVHPLPPGPSRRLALARLPATPEAVVAYLREKLAQGGCAAVICNTVGRAQSVYLAVREAGLVPPEDCLLFHARYPFAWRHEKEVEVLARFGKKGRRPLRAVVVATQVIEQSLDLDFDWMVSELCPIDLLIQRAGRLWRHQRSDEIGRPPRAGRQPELAVAEPEGGEEGDPRFGADAHVYDPYYLLRTLACLEGRAELSLPEDSARLVEAVYGEQAAPPAAPALAERIAAARDKMLRERAGSVANARSRLVLPPEDEGFASGENVGLEEDNPEVHAALQALTREAPPGITLVCLHRKDGGALAADPGDPATVVDPGAPPSEPEAKQLMAHALQVQTPHLLRHFARQAPPEGWREHPALRHCRLVIFENGTHVVEGTPYRLHLDRELGLWVDKEV